MRVAALGAARSWHVTELTHLPLTRRMRWLVFVVVALLAAPGCHASGTPLPVDGTSCSGCDNRFTCSSHRQWHHQLVRIGLSMAAGGGAIVHHSSVSGLSMCMTWASAAVAQHALKSNSTAACASKPPTTPHHPTPVQPAVALLPGLVLR